MAKVFGLTPPKIDIPKPQAAVAAAIPQATDQQIRDAKLKQIADLDRTSGPTANRLTESRLGDYSKAPTRSGALPGSSIVSGRAA